MASQALVAWLLLLQQRLRTTRDIQTNLIETPCQSLPLWVPLSLPFPNETPPPPHTHTHSLT